MMYNSKLAVAIKSNGKVLREFGETVYVPFGTEYTILVKNMNTVRALVSVSIDGDDVGDGVEFVIPPNDSVELERFVKNGNMKKGNRFKFIERTESVEEHRGIDVEDGLIRVEYKFEKEIQPLDIFINTYRDVCKSPEPWGPYQPRIWYGNDSGNPPPFGVHDITCNAGDAEGPGNVLRSSMNISSSMASGDEPVQVNYSSTEGEMFDLQQMSDTGVTVPGSVSDQKFKTSEWFPTESESHVIVFKMLGETEENERVRKPVTVKAKPKCVTCGKKNKATAKFCSECGTSLTII